MRGLSEDTVAGIRREQSCPGLDAARDHDAFVGPRRGDAGAHSPYVQFARRRRETGGDVSTYSILEGDVLEMARTLPDCSFDAVLCDPPYGRSSNDGKGKPRTGRA